MVRTQMFTIAAGDRENVPNFAILITDGGSNIQPVSSNISIKTISQSLLEQCLKGKYKKKIQILISDFY